MSANVPTDIRFSFSGLAARGGDRGPHRDGFGIVFYRGKGIQEFRDEAPGFESPVAELVQKLPIRSTAVIAHVRQANVGAVNLENTHPFHREFMGRHFTWAHNGQMPGCKSLPIGRFKPVGSTDSEYGFCHFMQKLERYESLPSIAQVRARFGEAARALSQFGVCNLVMSDGRALYVWRTSKLVSITRRAPFGPARLQDADLAVDFSNETTPKDVVTVVATEPLTTDEEWDEIPLKTVRVLKQGEWQ